MLDGGDTWRCCDEVGAFLGCETDYVGLEVRWVWGGDIRFRKGWSLRELGCLFREGLEGGRKSIVSFERNICVGSEGTAFDGRKFSHTETGLGKANTSAMTLTLNRSTLITMINQRPPGQEYTPPEVHQTSQQHSLHLHQKPSPIHQVTSPVSMS